MDNAVFSWSGGKDSAYCLNKVLSEGHYNVKCLLTNLNKSNNRISMHGVRKELIEQQANSLNIPLDFVETPEMPDMETYERAMFLKLTELKKQNINNIVFGDLFLADLRKYREEQVKKAGVTPAFPVWNTPSHVLISDFISRGFKAIVVCVNSQMLDKSFTGRILDQSFLDDLPSEVDPCGENGEYHSFVYDGPGFREPIKFEKGELVFRDYGTQKNTAKNSTDTLYTSNKTAIPSGFWFYDLLPG